MAVDLSYLERAFLTACHELVKRQQELLPQLAAALGVPTEELFYSWMERRFPNVPQSEEESWKLQTGRIAGTDWGYFFHGLECDLCHVEDGRYVRVEFGPRGRTDTLSGYAVLQFVMTSKSPWPEFADLKAHLAEKPPPYHHHSGSYEKMVVLWTRLEEAGLLMPAAPDLCALVEAHTTRLPNGHSRIALPDNLPERTVLDCMVCGRSVLSDAAHQVVDEPPGRDIASGAG